MFNVNISFFPHARVCHSFRGKLRSPRVQLIRKCQSCVRFCLCAREWCAPDALLLTCSTHCQLHIAYTCHVCCTRMYKRKHSIPIMWTPQQRSRRVAGKGAGVHMCARVYRILFTAEWETCHNREWCVASTIWRSIQRRPLCIDIRHSLIFRRVVYAAVRMGA